MLALEVTKRSDWRLLERMANHYSHPGGFVGRSICYAILYNGVYYGHIVGGSATRFLPGRHEFLGTSSDHLNNIVNNVFYNVSPVGGSYPLRNFTSRVVAEFTAKISGDWLLKYGDVVLGLETLVEKPRTGELYLRAGWTWVGETKGYTCRRESGVGNDSWTGKRVWVTTDPKPKNILCKKIGDNANLRVQVSEMPDRVFYAAAYV